MDNIAESILRYFEKELPRHYENNQIRLSQVQMALDIAAFLHPSNKKRILIIEAPVGTGKSLGGLIPSMVSAIEQHRKVLYATATINLQGQLMSEEIPILKKFKLVKQPILAKGKTHYYCHRQFIYNKKYMINKYGEDYFTPFFNRSDTGHRDNFEEHYLEVKDQDWKKIALNSSTGECMACEWSEICPTYLHRKSFLNPKNDLTVTNHDQLIMSVRRVLEDLINAPIVPIQPGVIILDEAHHFLENYLGQLEEKVTIEDLKNLKRNIPENLKQRYTKELRSLKNQLNKESEDKESLSGRYPISEELTEILSNIRKIINEAIAAKEAKRIGKNSEYYAITDPLDSKSSLLYKFNKEGYTYWMNYEENSFSVLADSFMEDFSTLIDRLTSRNKVIVMSGTLSYNKSLDSMIQQWRLTPEEVCTSIIEPSFDYSKQARIYVPQDLLIPRPNDKKYIKKQIKHIKELLALTDGSSLVLTTAKIHLEKFDQELSPFLDQTGINLLKQEQGGVEQLTKRFKQDKKSVLIGSGSFFSGFSVRGDSLISVILNKLPFPTHDDPILKLIGQGLNEKEYHNTIIFPNMMNKLNQALGRLIRDISDYGIITILDPRIFERRYSRKIREDLEDRGYIITRDFDIVKNFLTSKQKGEGSASYPLYSRDHLHIASCLTIERRKPININVKAKKIELNQDSENKYSTKKQRDFINEFCIEHGIERPKYRFAKKCYEYLYDELKNRNTDTVILAARFPFKDKSQKDSFTQYAGGTKGRKYQLPKCHVFGCSGKCSEVIKKEITSKVEEKGGKVKDYFNNEGYCIIYLEPISIVGNF